MSLAALLMGVANRASDVKRRDEARQYGETLAGKQAQSQYLIKQIEDPSLPDEERQAYEDSFEKLHKLPGGIVSFGRQMHPHLNKLVQQHAPQLAPSVEQQQMPSAPATPAPAATEPVAGGGGRLGNVPAMPTNEQQPLQALPQATPTLGMPPSPPPSMQEPDTELGRRQQQAHNLMQQNMSFIDSLGLPPEQARAAKDHLLNISSVVQAAGVRGQYDLQKEDIKGRYGLAKAAIGSGNQGQSVVYQKPGGGLPRTLFQVTKGPQAGKLLDLNTKQETQLEEGEVPVYRHPDKVELLQDPDTKEITAHNISKELEESGKSSVNLGKGQKLGSGTSSGKAVAVRYLGDDGVNYLEYKTPEEAKAMGKLRAPEPQSVVTRKVAAQNSMKMAQELYDYIDRPDVQKTMGPWSGRVSSWETFLGNPPPEFSELHGMFISWTDLQPAIHAMRSAEMAKEIERQVGPQVSGEALKAFVRGFNKTAQVVSESGVLYPSNEELAPGSFKEKPSAPQQPSGSGTGLGDIPKQFPIVAYFTGKNPKTNRVETIEQKVTSPADWDKAKKLIPNLKWRPAPASQTVQK